MKLKLGPVGAGLALSISCFHGQETKPTRLPEVTSTDTPLSRTPTQERRNGANKQPEWTAQRRFSTTHIYVLPPLQFELEQWWEGKFPRHGKAYHLFQSEVGIGLPYRFQLDLYENIERTTTGT